MYTKIVNGEVVELTSQEIENHRAKETKWDEGKEARERERIAEKRKSKYPDIGDQLDALYKHLEATTGVGTQTELGKIITKWKKVKTDNPYPKE